MAGKLKSVYICSQCGYESSKWNGKCPSCGEWNTFEEEVVEASPKSAGGKSVSSIKTVNLSSKIVTLSGIDTEEDVR